MIETQASMLFAIVSGVISIFIYAPVSVYYFTLIISTLLKTKIYMSKVKLLILNTKKVRLELGVFCQQDGGHSVGHKKKGFNQKG